MIDHIKKRQKERHDHTEEIPRCDCGRFLKKGTTHHVCPRCGAVRRYAKQRPA